MKVTYGPTKDGRHGVAKDGELWVTNEDPEAARKIANSTARENGTTATFVESGVDDNVPEGGTDATKADATSTKKRR